MLPPPFSAISFQLKIFITAQFILVSDSLLSNSAFCSLNPENIPSNGAAASHRFHEDTNTTIRNCTYQKGKKLAFSLDLED